MNVLYCIDGNAVWYCCKGGTVVKILLKIGVMYSGMCVVRYLFELSTKHARPNNIKKMEAKTSSQQARSQLEHDARW